MPQPNEPVRARDTIERVAIKLHRLFCDLDHTEVCNWYYETSWEAWTHQRYWRMAEYFKARMDTYEMDVVRAVTMLQDAKILVRP